MCMKFQTASEQVGLDKLPFPKLEKQYAAYKNGEAKTFDTRAKALEFSKNIEAINVNQEEYQAAKYAWYQLENKAIELWKYSLQAYYPNVSDAVFELIYTKAYEDKHSYGYDAIADNVDDLIYFVLDVIKAHNQGELK